MEQFNNVLKSLSQISHFDFAINNRSDLLFSSRPEPHDSHLLEYLRRFSAKTLDDATFRTESQEQYNLYGIPIGIGDDPFAALIAYNDRGEDPAGNLNSAKMKTFLCDVAELIGEQCVARKESEELAEQLAQSFEAIALYSRITPQITSLGFSESVLQNLIQDVFEAMGAELTFTSIPDREGYSLLMRREGLSHLVADPDGFVKGLVDAIPKDDPCLQDHYYIVDDSRSFPDYQRLCAKPFRFLATPIEHQNSSYGWLGMVSFKTGETFRYSELRMLITVAKQIAVALSNIDLYQELEQFVINVVRSLVYAIEAKDLYTRGHSERVSQYCMGMAEKLRLSKEEKRRLLWAAVLHDTGKIGISETVLNKPGSLSEEEYGAIKTHPEKGYKILQPLKPLVKSLEGILHHHECYGGNGYPSGLKGEEIPLQARIIAVADTFDAMTSDRSYRPRKSPDEAMAILREIAGTQLDPHLVPVFLQAFEGKVKSGTGSLPEEPTGADGE
jgi:HD-GYP domain-containing protein (c-di-GMP phosphodiesterase class II)